MPSWTNVLHLQLENGIGKVIRNSKGHGLVEHVTTIDRAVSDHRIHCTCIVDKLELHGRLLKFS